MQRHRLTRPLVLGCTLLGACGDSTSTSPPVPAAGVYLAAVDSGYSFPTFLTAPPGDPSRVLIVERGGRIVLRKNGVQQAAPFLDLTDLTGEGHEYGVYSIAFHPQYQTNHRLFAYYVDNDGNTQVSEFTIDPSLDSAVASSEQSILFQAQSATAVLYGGMIGFGGDGDLYIAIGDGDNGGDPLSKAQDSMSLLGKILRIDVDHAAPYSIPADNPYHARPGWREEIWQLGLRNPWRWSFDRNTGDLYIGDVGEERWEEVDVLTTPVAGGNNFGWPLQEGKNCYQPEVGCPMAGLIQPALEYPHGRACAVAGGYVYRGAAAPALEGTYFYGDFCDPVVRSFKYSGGVPREELPEVPIPPVNGAGDNTVSFGEDASGEVYVVTASGRIYQIRYRNPPD